MPNTKSASTSALGDFQQLLAMGEGSASGTGRYDQRWLAECGAAQVLLALPRLLPNCSVAVTRNMPFVVCVGLLRGAIKLRLTRPRPFCWIARPDGRGLNTLMVPSLPKQQPNGTPGKKPTGTLLR
jgi:hypothetical protein